MIICEFDHSHSTVLVQLGLCGPVFLECVHILDLLKTDKLLLGIIWHPCSTMLWHVRNCRCHYYFYY